MAKSSISLFSRLYLSILITIVVSVVLTRTIVEFMYLESDFKEFLVDSQHIHYELLDQLSSEPLSAKELTLPLPLGLEYGAKLLLQEQGICEDCNLKKSSEGINYYSIENNEFLVEYSALYTPYSLVIYRLSDEQQEAVFGFHEIEMEEFNFDEVLVAMTLLTFLTFVAVTVYLPIRKLQMQIKQLVSTHQQFGSGDLEVTADNQIQRPLNELADSFNLMAAAINENVKERDTFAQAIPHEIRTPLSRIQLAAGLIRKKSHDPEILQLVNDTDDYVTDINQLINQIVQFSRVNTDKRDVLSETLKTFVLKDFIESRLDSLFPDSQLSVQVNVDKAISIKVNPAYLRLVMDNLLKNAATYANKEIKVHAVADQQFLSVCVEDDGPGIPDSQKETVFIPFARLDKSRSRKTGGLGLGLSIAKAATKRMKGELTLRDSALGGAGFELKIDKVQL